MATPIVRHIADLTAFRLRENATNKMVALLPAGMAGGRTSMMLEIWDVGGRQPENVHPRSAEIFFFLAGEGRAHCDGATTAVGPGDLVVLPAGSSHYIENVGAGRLCALTTLLVDDGSHENPADAGIPLEDEELMLVLGRAETPLR